MIDLTDEQLIKLSTLIYLADFTEYSEDKISEVVNTEYDDLSNWQSDTVRPNGQSDLVFMDRDEWRVILDFIKADSTLMNLTVTNPISLDSEGTSDKRPKGHDNTGFRGVCLVNDKGEAVVVFRGTGSAEWSNDGKGAVDLSTEGQERALEYINSLEYDDLLVTGHSNGGNEAQYVTVLAGNKVRKAVSIDGQGFSEEFVNRYKSEIFLNSFKLHAINAEKDPVSGLLNSIIPEKQKKYIRTKGQFNFINYHKPNLLLDKHGKLNEEGRPSHITRYMNDLSAFYSENYSDTKHRYVASDIMSILDGDYAEKDRDAQMESASFFAGKMMYEYMKGSTYDRFKELNLFISDASPINLGVVDTFATGAAITGIQAMNHKTNIDEIEQIYNFDMAHAASDGIITNDEMRDITTKNILLKEQANMKSLIEFTVNAVNTSTGIVSKFLLFMLCPSHLVADAVSYVVSMVGDIGKDAVDKGYDLKIAEINERLYSGYDTVSDENQHNTKTYARARPREYEPGQVYDYLTSIGTKVNTDTDYGDDSTVFFYARNYPAADEKPEIFFKKEDKIFKNLISEPLFTETIPRLPQIPQSTVSRDISESSMNAASPDFKEKDFKSMLDSKVSRDEMMDIFAEKLLEKSRVSPPSPFSRLAR